MSGRLSKMAIAAAVLLCFCGHVDPAAASGGKAADPYTPGDFRRITALTAKLLDRNHYSGKRMTGELSARIFDNFFNALDPGHIFFTVKDVESFADYRAELGRQLQYGEYEFAFKVYDVYRRRYGEFREFTGRMLSEKIDFTVDEEMEIGSEKPPRPADEAAMRELWRKYLKNELLIMRLSARSEAMEREKRAKETPKDGKEVREEDPRKVKDPVQRIFQRQRDIGNVIAKRERIDILGILLNAMAQAYGAHSDYQAPKLSEDFEIHMSLSLSGIGATLTSEDGYIKIVELVPGGPAELSGKVKVNDRIVSVTQEDGVTTDLMDMPVSQAVQFIRGKKGSRVTLELLSGNASATVRVELVRDKINLTAGAAKGEIREVDGVKVGVITLPSFYMDFDAAMRGDADARKASSDVLRILQDFRKNSVESVVIDLRSNGGGSLPDAVSMSGLFMKGGPVVQIRSKEGMELESDNDPAAAYDGPLVVLTSKLSASAAEIFTGALRDAGRAVVVGDSRTFGKGTILRVESLDRYNNWFRKKKPSGSLTFEIAMFFRPSGSSVQQLGIAPDIMLPSLTEEMKVGEIFLDSHLPWDSIKAVPGQLWDAGLRKKIAALRAKSKARIAADAQYQAFIRQIGIYRSIRDRRSISLNEETRFAEYLKEKKIAEEAEKLMAEENPVKKSSGDLVLNEALHIAADLSKLE